MALIQKPIIDKIEVLANCILQVRQNNQIIDDSNNSVIASSFERWVLNPGDDVSNQDEKIKAIANTLWTNDVISAYKASIVENPIPNTNAPSIPVL